MTNAELIAALRYCGGEEKYCKLCPSYDTCHAEVDGLKQILLAAADALEAADKRIAELMPKEGEWIYTPLERYKEYKVKCPFCGAEYHDCYDGYIDAEDMNYCPNCGAKMKGEQE